MPHKCPRGFKFDSFCKDESWAKNIASSLEKLGNEVKVVKDGSNYHVYRRQA